MCGPLDTMPGACLAVPVPPFVLCSRWAVRQGVLSVNYGCSYGIRDPFASVVGDVIQLIQLDRPPTMLTSSGTLILGVSLLLLVALWRLVQIRRAFGHFSQFPTYSTLLSPLYPLGRALPLIPWVAPGPTFGWKDVYECKFPNSMIAETCSLT